MSSLFSLDSLDPVDIEHVASGYRYNRKAMLPLEQHLRQQIESYAGEYGPALMTHLKRTSQRLYSFLRYTKMDKQAAQNIAAAFAFHDLGKTLQPPALWNLPEKPDEQTRRLRIEHAALGPVALEKILDSFEGDMRIAIESQRRHLSLMACFMRFHHERINGTGPQRLSGAQLGHILEMAGIVDSADGKFLTRHGKAPRSEKDALLEMTGIEGLTNRPEKHGGEFAFPLLERYIRLREKNTQTAILAPHVTAPKRNYPSPSVFPLATADLS